MRWFNHFPLIAAAVLLVLPAGALAAPPDTPAVGTPPVPPAAKGDDAADSPGQAVQVASSDLSSLNRLLPVGKTARKVTVPTVDEEGRLTSLVTMGSITRIDEDNFALEKVVLTSYDRSDGDAPDAAADQTVITLINARYHAPTRVLASDRQVTIRKPTLYMTGESLHYDSAAGRALIKGRAQALITDAPRPEPAPEPEEPEALDDDADEDEKSEPEAAPASPPTPKRP